MDEDREKIFRNFALRVDDLDHWLQIIKYKISKNSHI